MVEHLSTLLIFRSFNSEAGVKYVHQNGLEEELASNREGALLEFPPLRSAKISF